MAMSMPWPVTMRRIFPPTIYMSVIILESYNSWKQRLDIAADDEWYYFMRSKIPHFK